MTLLEKVLELKPNMSFSSYYKYSFNFVGKVTLENGDLVEISASIGGSADSIYRLEINPNKVETLSKDNFNFICVKNTTTNESDEWNDY